MSLSSASMGLEKAYSLRKAAFSLSEIAEFLLLSLKIKIDRVLFPLLRFLAYLKED